MIMTMPMTLSMGRRAERPRRIRGRSRNRRNSTHSFWKIPAHFPFPSRWCPFSVAAAVGHRIVWDTWLHVLVVIIPHPHTEPSDFPSFFVFRIFLVEGKFINKLSLLLSNSDAAWWPPAPSWTGRSPSFNKWHHASVVIIPRWPPLPSSRARHQQGFIWWETAGRTRLQPRSFNCCRNGFLLTFTWTPLQNAFSEDMGN